MPKSTELGTRLSETITAITGKEPCEGCKHRAAVLNEVGRRGFLRGGMFAAFVVKNKMLKGLWHLAGATTPIGVTEALAFIRQSNTFPVGLFYRNGSFASRNDLFKELIAHREHFIPGTLGHAWMSQVSFFSDEVLPGWILDFANVSEGYPRNMIGDEGPIPVNDGFRLVLRGRDFTFITEETGIIYRAPTIQNAPSARSLRDASSFPGAVELSAIPAEATAWQRIKNFFTPVVYAAACCGTQRACQACACCDCLACNECDLHCASWPIPGRCIFNTACGTCAGRNCLWIVLGCGSKACNCSCAVLFGGCCTSISGCSSCPKC